ncbi:hypothetical protein Ptr902_03792 [Pyrenophora tritici-repentis]|nr:hypothetical protein Ptr902_03792 [Pyrenophora tritici-repentis]
MKFFAILITVIPAVLAVCQPPDNQSNDRQRCLQYCETAFASSPTCIENACGTW